MKKILVTGGCGFIGSNLVDILVQDDNNDVYVITQEGDRLDNLAFQYYGDSNLWWYIATANQISTMNVPNGTSLRIPSSTQFAKGK